MSKVYCLYLESSTDAQGKSIYRVANCQPELNATAICGPILKERWVYTYQEVEKCSDGRLIVECQVDDQSSQRD